jgi:hypothetical protein
MLAAPFLAPEGELIPVPRLASCRASATFVLATVSLPDPAVAEFLLAFSGIDFVAGIKDRGDAAQ